jgi:hypothetical protein
MDWVVYGALIVGALAAAGGTALLAVRVLQGWRSLKRTRRHLARTLEELAHRADHTAEIVERISDQREVESSLARLRTSLAALAVLRAAVGETDDSLRRAAAVYPRK